MPKHTAIKMACAGWHLELNDKERDLVTKVMSLVCKPLNVTGNLY